MKMVIVFYLQIQAFVIDLIQEKFSSVKIPFSRELTKIIRRLEIFLESCLENANKKSVPI